jgi:two-component system cell cycle sensor histidine kinase PleC
MSSLDLAKIAPDAGEYELDRFRLQFRDRGVESRFQRETLPESMTFIRAYFLAGTVLYMLFGILDSLVGGASLHSLLLIRFGVVAPTLLGLFALTFFPIFQRMAQFALATAMLASGGGIIAMTAIMEAPFNSRYYAGLIMVVSYCGSLIRLRFFYSLLIALFLIGCYQVVSLGINPIPLEEYISNNFFLAMSTGVGLFSSYIHDLYFRHSYVARKIIEEKSRLSAVLLEESDKANKSKSEFLATMSHELRTPLNAIIGFSDVIKRELFGAVGNDRYVDYAKDIYDSGAHLLAIINDILDLARAESGKLKLNESEFEVYEVLESCVRMCRGRAETGKVDIRFDESNNGALISADKRLFFQIVINLVTNAIKFTPEGGEVRLSASTGFDQGVIVRVSDTGIGIAAEDLGRVLRPFEQVEGSYVRQKGGAGLGLPYAKRLAELHGGALTLESEPGRGTVATVTLPRERVVRQRAQEHAA